MKVSLCITTYNRVDLTLKSFARILNDARVDDIVIVDDYSSDKVFRELSSKCFSSKISLYRNTENLGMSRNKAKAISFARNEWCIIFDSDNIIDSTYLDALERAELFEDTIYMPSAALPNFDFREFSGLLIDQYNVKEYMNTPMFRVALNACNYVVQREKYLATYKHDPTIKGTDTISHNLNHLKAGGSFYIVPGMTYSHLVHAASGFMEHVDYNMKKAAEIENKIRML